MQIVRPFSRAAVVALAVASMSAAHAAPFKAPTDLDFSFSATILGLLGTGPVYAGSPGVTINAGTIALPTSAVSLSSPSAADLLASSAASFSVTATGPTGAKSQLDLSGLSFDNVAKSLSATISYNGAKLFQGVALTATAASQVPELFDATKGTGLLTSGDLFLTSGAATAVLTGMGLGYLAPTAMLLPFGQVKVDVTAAVPEPSTWAMMGLGLGLTAWSVRRRKPASA